MTHKIEWRQNAQNWFIRKFDGIWMDLLCAWHLNWNCSACTFNRINIRSIWHLLHTMASINAYAISWKDCSISCLWLSSIDWSTQPLIAYSIRFRNISYICNAYISLCGCEKFIALWQNQIAIIINHTQLMWEHNEEKNAFNAKENLQKANEKKKKDKCFNRKVFQAYLLSCVWLVEFDCR